MSSCHLQGKEEGDSMAQGRWTGKGMLDLVRTAFGDGSAGMLAWGWGCARAGESRKKILSIAKNHIEQGLEF